MTRWQVTTVHDPSMTTKYNVHSRQSPVACVLTEWSCMYISCLFPSPIVYGTLIVYRKFCEYSALNSTLFVSQCSRLILTPKINTVLAISINQRQCNIHCSAFKWHLRNMSSADASLTWIWRWSSRFEIHAETEWHYSQIQFICFTFYWRFSATGCINLHCLHTTWWSISSIPAHAKQPQNWMTCAV
jgi:hypothetical protein